MACCRQAAPLMNLIPSGIAPVLSGVLSVSCVRAKHAGCHHDWEHENLKGGF